MNPPPMDPQFRAVFLAEADALLGRLNRGLVHLENHPDDEPVRDDVLRAAHTLKGSSRLLKLDEIGHLAHALEEEFSARDRTGFESLFSLLDQLNQRVDDVRRDPNGRDESEPAPPPERGASDPAVRSTTPLPPTPAPGADLPMEAGRAAPSLAHPTPALIRVRPDDLGALADRVNQMTLDNLTWESQVAEFVKMRTLAQGLLPTDGPMSNLRKELDRQFIWLREAQATHTSNLRELEGITQEMHMRPLATILDSLPRAARDLAQELHKRVEVELDVQNVALDQEMLDHLRVPLIHLLRNAIDHGIELPAERRAQGKPPVGSVHIEARREGPMVIAEVRDDGAGIDLEAVRDRAQELALLDDPDSASPSQVLDCIFHPGFSTRHTTTEISGRGVGMDLVRTQVTSVGGKVEITSERGRGTSIFLRIPSSLATLDVMRVRANGRAWSLAAGAVEEVVKLDAHQLSTMASSTVLRHGDRLIPYHPLAALLDPTAPKVPSKHALIVRSLASRAALGVDEVMAVAEAVVRPLPTGLPRAAGISGATINARGELVPFLEPAILLDPLHSPAALPDRHRAPQPMALVVDDSISTAAIIRAILESVGFAVRVAHDGAEALERARAQVFSLIVSDVEMPRMNGLELITALKADATTAQIPVVMVTNRDRGLDRRNAIEAGASAYLSKATLEQDRLINVIRQLLPGL